MGCLFAIPGEQTPHTAFGHTQLACLACVRVIRFFVLHFVIVLGERNNEVRINRKYLAAAGKKSERAIAYVV